LPVVQDYPQRLFIRGAASPPRPAASGLARRAVKEALSGARRLNGPVSGARRLAAPLTILMMGAGSLAGCAPGGAPLGAPAISLFGAYFPAWLLCAFIGVIGAVLVRVAFIRVGLDDMFPVRLPVYVAVAVIIGLLVSFFGFGR